MKLGQHHFPTSTRSKQQRYATLNMLRDVSIKYSTLCNVLVSTYCLLLVMKVLCLCLTSKKKKITMDDGRNMLFTQP